MKILLSILIVLCTINVQAKNFYISATGNDANNGLSPATPWKTISKLNASFSTIVAGDSILFKSGESFYGTITVGKSGTSSLPIVIGKYGSGAKPVITGFTTISSWTSLGNNIWEAAIPGGLPTLNMAVIKGISVPMGRYPNADAAVSGYRTYSNFASNASITDAGLSASPNWQNGDLIVRRNSYSSNRITISNHSGGTLSFAGPAGTPFEKGSGYFIQNHLATLDQKEEWFYDAATKKIKIFNVGTPPSVQVPTLNNLVHMVNAGGTVKSYITFSDISFIGCEEVAMVLTFCNYIKVNNCDFSYVGETGIYHKYVIGLTVQNSSFSDINMVGINGYNGSIGSDITIKQNNFRRIGIHPGMISKSTVYMDGASGCAINIVDANVLVEENTFDSIGYNAVSVRISKNNQVVRKNIISNFCIVKNDGGGIYNSGLRGGAPVSNILFEGNIIFKSSDASHGTAHPNNPHARGIYLDASSAGVQVLNNTIFDTWEAIYISQAQNNILDKNTIYNCGSTTTPHAGALAIADGLSGYKRTRSNTITNNIIAAKTTTQLLYLHSSPDSVEAIGLINNNRYVTLTTTPLFVWNYGPNNYKYSFQTWKSTFPVHDKNSVNTIVTTGPRFEYNPGATAKTISFPGMSYKDAFGNNFANSVTIAPYGSVILLGGSAVPNVLPLANAGSDQSITLPVNSISVNCIASDADGSITEFVWTRISGPNTPSIASPTSAGTAINNLVQGVYLFQVQVKDNVGAIAKDTVVVTVYPAVNIPAIAHAGADVTLTLPLNTVTITGSGTDIDGTISNYTWSKISGPASGIIETPNTASTNLKNLVFGVYKFELKVTDNSGATGRDTLQVTVNAALNKAPSANAGSDKDITLPANNTTLTGSGTDEDGTISSYKWTKVSGPAAGTIASTNSATTMVNNLVQGVYEFELTVTDNNGAVAKDMVQVTVNKAPNKAPVANAGNDQSITLPTNTTLLTGSGSDEDGNIVKYAWMKIAGPSASISSANAATATISNLKAGVYQYQLTVTDNEGATSKDTVQVTVNVAENIAPSANAGTDANITLPINTLSLTGAGTDVDGTISSYAWTKVSGPATGNISSPNSATTIINNLVQGVYEFELTVTDNNGAVAKDIVQVTVNKAPNKAPVANAGNDVLLTLPTNTTLLTGSGTDEDGNIVKYAWVKISGPSNNISSANAATATISNLKAGVYQYQLTVTDNEAATAKDTVQVTVNIAPNKVPVADAGTSHSITLPVDSTTLTGSGTDVDGTISSYSWTKISGPAAGNILSPNSNITSINNLVQGLYEFELTVTDNKGAPSKDTLQVTVNDALNQAPVATAGISQTITLPVNNITLTGIATDDDGIISSYAWTKISGPVSGIIASANAATTLVEELTEGIYTFELTVTDDDGAISKDIVQVIVNPIPNVAPTADAGFDIVITLPTQSATLTGSGTDTDGTISSYEWLKISGPSTGTIAIPSAASTTISDLILGIYKYELTVMDNAGAISKDTVLVTVNPADNLLPVADAGMDQSITLPENTIVLNGAGTDTDGSIANHAWTQISGPSNATIISHRNASSSVHNLLQGIYEFELTVTDNEGATSTDIVQVIVNGQINQAPIANAGTPQTIILPANTIILTSISEDSDGFISNYAWTQVSGPSASLITTPDAPVTTIINLVQGIYEYELTITDDDGAVSRDTVTVTVNEALNQLPHVDAGTDQAIDLPINYTTLNGSGTDVDGTIAGYNWIQISGPAASDMASPGSATTSINNLVTGVYGFELTITDDKGAFAKDTVRVTVNTPLNEAPTADAGVDQVIQLPVNFITLSGSGADQDGIINSYSWLKISGPAAGITASPFSAATSVTELEAGVYEYELTVGDDKGALSRDTVQITVYVAENKVPAADAGPDHSIELPNNSINLTGNGTDIDGTVSGYTWIKISGPNGGLIATPGSAATAINDLVQGIYQFELTVADNEGAIAKDTVEVTVNAAPNQAPVAVAGTNQSITLPVNSTILTGSGTDVDGTINTYSWTKISGPVTGNIISPNNSTTPIENLVQGLYEFELTVTDNEGALSKDTLEVTVNDALNQAPVATAGISQAITLPVNSVTLTGSATDADGTISSYIWAKISGPVSGSIASANTATTLVENLSEGTYTFELTVTDNDGAISKDITQVLVNKAANKAPIAQAGPDKVITLPTNTVQLNGAGTDEDGTIVKYAWRKLTGPSATNTTPNAASTTIRNLKAGIYFYQFTVTDNNGAISKDTLKITVNAAPNQAPIAYAGLDQSITLPVNETMLSGSGTDLEGSISSYAWIKIAGPAAGTIATPNAATTLLNNLVQGMYQYELTVKDDKGSMSRDTLLVTVNAAPNQAPAAFAGTDLTITLPVSDTSLTGEGIDVDGTISNYTWTKISGPVNGTVAATHSAITAINDLVQGIYQFELTVADNEGAIAKDTVEVTVNAAPNQTPVAVAGTNQSITLPVNSTILTGSGTDVDGTINTYSWTKISGPVTGNIISPNNSTTPIENLVQGLYEFELTVTDNEGALSKDTLQVTVNDALNQAPVATAGISQAITLPVNSVTLAGSATDADGTISSYVWAKISGPVSGSIASANTATTLVENLSEGTYTFELTVTDSDGAISKDITQVLVNKAANKAPVAQAGPDKVITLPTNTVQLNGAGTDEDGTIVTFEWRKIGGISGSILSTDEATTQIENLIEGVYQFQLIVTDNEGAVSKDTVQVTVKAAPNQAPTADAGIDHSITLPVNETILSGSGTDLDGTISGYAWLKIAGPAAGTIASPNAPSTLISNLVQGLYQYELTVSDNHGVTAKDTIRLTVNAAPNQAPGSYAGSNKEITLPENSTLLEGEGIDADGTIVQYAWTKISGPVAGTIQTPSSPNTIVNNLVKGIYQYQLTVTDNNGAISSDTTQVTVNPAPNQAPVAGAGANQTITLPVNSTTLTGSGTDVDGTISSFVWTKISGPAASIVSPTSATTLITNLVAGIYQFELSITDNEGAISIAIIQVTVQAAPNVVPQANAGTDKTITLPVNSVILSGAGTDVDGIITDFKWIKISGPSGGTIISPNAAMTLIDHLIQGVYQYQFTITDNDGAISQDTVQIIVHSAPNQAPVADAGADIIMTLPANSTTLTGTGTDRDGSISSYIWLRISGPVSGTIKSPYSGTTAVSELVQGIYQYQLVITDNNGAVAKDTVKVTVLPAVNVAPIADAGTDQIITLPVNNTTLIGSGTDIDGIISSYAWVKISGPAAGTIASPGSGITAINNLVAGIYQYQLTVTDNNGAVAKSTVRITVNAAANRAPVANAGTNKSITLPTNSTTLSGSGTDSDGTISGYAWSMISGPAPATIASPVSAATSINDLVQGTYQFQLSVKDNNGAISKDTVTVTVNKAPNQAPVAIAGADKVITLPTNTVTLTGIGNDLDGTITSYSWLKISGPSAGSIDTPNSGTTVLTQLVEGVYLFQLTIKDNEGAVAKDTVKVTVNAAPNKAPVANAGTDKTLTLPTNSISLTGTGTDSDGTIKSFVWVKISGPSSGTIVSPSSATTVINKLVEGNYLYQLTITDDDGAASSDTVKIIVNRAPNKAPEANAGNDKIITLPTNSTTLIGKGTDVDGTINSYAWVKISGPAAGSIGSSNLPTTAINNLAQGIYNYQLTVTDNEGAISRDTVKVTVNKAQNQNPQANAGPDKIITLPINSVTLTGSGKDSDGTISSYAWTKVSGPAGGSIGSAKSATTAINNLAQGIYNYQLTVTDNEGAITRDTVKVTVNKAPNQKPVASAGADKTITLPTNSVTLTGSGTDADGTISSFAWIKISGPAAGKIATANAATTIINNLVDGIYTYELTVTDNDKAIAKDTVRVTVNKALTHPPAANAGSDISIILPVNSVTLMGSGVDHAGVIVSYSWIKISGPVAGTIASPSAAITAITNLVQGQYQFQLTVTNNDGLIARDTVKVTVSVKLNQPPVVNAGTNKTITLPVNSTILTGSGSDPDGIVKSFAWRKIAGTGGTIASPAASITSVTNLVQGIYLFELAVTDSSNAVAKDTVQVTVNAAVVINKVPAANAGADINIVLPVNSATLTGTGTDQDGTIVSYGWKVLSGPANHTLLNPVQKETIIENLFQGVYQVELTVTDNGGKTGKDTLMITVASPRMSNYEANKFKVYPNPVQDIANLTINTVNVNTKVSVSVMNLQGKQVSQKAFVTTNTDTNYKLNMSNLSNGFYIITLRFDDGKVISSKVVKNGTR